MIAPKNSETPPVGVDQKVWKGVLVGLTAFHARKGPGKTVSINIDRYDQRLFTLPTSLDDAAVETATVVLNGRPCVLNRDYTISGNLFNWVADRKLVSSDAIAIRYKRITPPLNIPAEVPCSSSDEEILGALSKISARVAELETVVEDVSNTVDTVAEPQEADVYTETCDTETTATLTEKEDVEMIEQGTKVWHRLTGEGPWIVIQNTVLNIKSRQEGGEEGRNKSSFVELAWSVQTDDGIRDFPEVVLTSRPPKKVGWSWPKKVALGMSAVLTTAAIVHAPTLLKLAGLIQ